MSGGGPGGGGGGAGSDEPRLFLVASTMLPKIEPRRLDPSRRIVKILGSGRAGLSLAFAMSSKPSSSGGGGGTSAKAVGGKSMGSSGGGGGRSDGGGGAVTVEPRKPRIFCIEPHPMDVLPLAVDRRLLNALIVDRRAL